MTQRTDRMARSAPGYYMLSNIYNSILDTVAARLDEAEEKDGDLAIQLYIPTATWGLKYWEETLGIQINLADSYETRRSRVAAAWRGIGNFGADLIKSVCEVFTNGEVDVRIRVPEFEVVITFIGKTGIPPGLADLQARVDEIVHAHLGIQWKFRYLTWDELDAFTWPWDTLDSMAFTWDTIEVYKI